MGEFDICLAARTDEDGEPTSTYSRFQQCLIRVQIRDKAEAELFVLLSQKCEPHRTSLQKRLECLLSVIEKTGKDSHSALSATRILVQIHEKLAQLIPVRYSPDLRHERKTGVPAPGELEEPPTRMK